MERTKLDIWDFDDTLIKSPGPAEYKHVASMARDMGMSIPTEDEIEENHYKWWDHPVSLNTHIFSFKPFLGLMALKDEDPADQVAVVTHRIPNMGFQVERVLDEISMGYDYLKLGGRTMYRKVDLIKPILENHRPFSRIRIFEDSMEELATYHDFFRGQTMYEVGEVQYYFVNQKNIFQVNPRTMYLGVIKKAGLLHLSSEEPAYK